MANFGWDLPPGCYHGDPNAPWNQREAEPMWVAESTVKGPNGKLKRVELDADPDDRAEAIAEAKDKLGENVACIELVDRESGEYLDERIWDDEVYPEPGDDYYAEAAERKAIWQAQGII